MKYFLFMLLAFILLSCGSKPITYNYEAQCSGVGTSGLYKIKIYTYAKSLSKAKEKSRSHAVHAVLFKGISGSGVLGNACRSQKPICNVSYSENQEWFDNFFNNGEYLKYVSFSNDGYVDAKDRLKIAGGGYKIGTEVIVQVQELRKRMEKEGFSRALNQGF